MPFLPANHELLEMRNDPQYLNWLAVGDALRMLCNGLREYAKTEMQDFHNLMSRNLSGYPLCTCPPGKTPAHVNTCRWATEIGNYHWIRRKKQIPWHQSDSSKWHDPNYGYWEIAKLFMSDLGNNSANVKDPDTTDPTGLLNLLYFCKYFKVNRDLVREVRECRNTWAHAPQQSISDRDKQAAFQKIFDLMDDVKLMKCTAVQYWRPAIEKARDEDVSQQHEELILKELRKCREYEFQEQQSRLYENISRLLMMVTVLLSTTYLPGIGSNCLRCFHCVCFLVSFLGFIGMGNKPLPPLDNGCPRAYMKSPIASYGFQMFNFSFDLNYKRSNFFGRKWLFQEMENIFLNESDQSGVLITGEPGSGKSALMAQLICSPSSSLFIHRNIIAYHMCDYSQRGKRNGAWFVRNLVDQIAGSFSEYSNYISNDQQVRDQLDKRCKEDVVGCFHAAILGPLREMKNAPDGLRYIIIDALDECFENNGRNSEILEILKFELIEFPDWLKVVITSRNWTAVTNKLPRMIHRLSLNPTDERNLQDIESYISHFFSGNTHFLDRLLEASGLQTSSNERMKSLIEIMKKRSEGNFLFVKTIVEYYNSTHGTVSLKTFPKRLDVIYRLSFERQFGEGYFSRFKEVFEVLAAARFPMNEKEIQYILHGCDSMYTASVTFQLLQDVSSFLRYGENGTITIYHKSFADWLMAQDDSLSSIFVNISNGHKCIAEYIFDVIEKKNSTPTLDEITTLALHVSSGGMLDRHITKLKSLNIDTIRDESNGDTVLHCLAVEGGNILILDTLIQMFPSPDILNNFMFTPAFYASYREDMEILKVFIKNGINLDYYIPEIARTGVLNNPTRRNVPYGHGLSLLFIAIAKGNLAMAELLIESGASVTQANSEGQAPFNVAVKLGQFEFIKLLFKRGAQPDAISLHHSAAKNYTQIVHFLLQHGGMKDKCEPCKPEEVFRHNLTIYQEHSLFCETALYAAVSKRHIEVVQILLSYDNSSLECPHFSGKTPLIVAVENNDTNMVSLLLKYDANVEAECPKDQTSLWLHTWRRSYCKIPLHMREHFLYNLDFCDKIVKCFLNNRALHLCAAYGFGEIAQQLIEAGANIMAKNFANVSAADIAAYYDHADLFHKLNHSLYSSNGSFLQVSQVPIPYIAHGCLGLLRTFSRNQPDFVKMIQDNKYAVVRIAANWSVYLRNGNINMDNLAISRNKLRNVNTTELVKHEMTRRLDLLIFIISKIKSVKDVPGFLNTRDSETGRIPLHFAAKAGFVDAVKYLVNSGSDWKVKDNQGKTPLELALDATPDNPERFEKFYNFKDEDISGTYMTTIFDETVAYLISLEKSDLNKCNVESALILSQVLAKEMPLSLYHLLKNGVNVHCYAEEASRPFLPHLMTSVLLGEELAKKLLGE